MKQPAGLEPLFVALRLLGLGWYVVTSVVVGTVVGVWLDRRTGLAPIFALLGLGLGLVAAGWGLYRMIAPLLDGAKRLKG